MGYKDYKKTFKDISKQINIMALFGNGVDIQLMKILNSNWTTSYQDFYEYLCNKNFNGSNLLFKKLKEDKEIFEKSKQHNSSPPYEKENWSDFESGLIEIVEQNEPKKVEEDLKEVQVEFANFLNSIITPKHLKEIGDLATTKCLAKESVENFLGDLGPEDYEKLSFPSKLKHHCVYNWEVMNFNYTSLLDNILFLDKEQFDNHPYEKSERNIEFKCNPRKLNGRHTRHFGGTELYGNIMLNIHHPHGYQSIPKSMLFGFDNGKNSYKAFSKPYWAQSDKKYKSYFGNTDLFIIYGLSLGKSDCWWWNNIINSLLHTKAELIIYNYNSNQETNEETIDRFIESVSEYVPNEGYRYRTKDREKLHSKIAVIQYTSDTKLKAFKLDKD